MVTATRVPSATITDDVSIPGRIERITYGNPEATPEVSIVIPTRDGVRRGLLDQLLEDLQDQTVEAFEVLLVIGDNRQGRAINRGVRQAKSEIIATMDDDTVLGTPRVLENLLRVLEDDPSIGMVG
ncbi:MAG: glycosyltransferase, partial [Planctomycetota bacterium]